SPAPKEIGAPQETEENSKPDASPGGDASPEDYSSPLSAAAQATPAHPPTHRRLRRFGLATMGGVACVAAFLLLLVVLSNNSPSEDRKLILSPAREEIGAQQEREETRNGAHSPETEASPEDRST